MEKVLVTGGNGLLGRYVVRELAGHFDVTVADRTDAGERQPDGPVDCLDLGALRKAVEGHDAVVHLAAIDAAIDAPPETFFHTNVLAAWNTLHTAFEAGIRRFVLCSSTSAYGLRSTEPRGVPRALPVREEHPLAASDPYGLSKRACETVADGFGRRGGVTMTILRPCFVAFPFEVPRMRDIAAGGTGAGGDDEWAPPLPPFCWFVTPEDAARCFAAALTAEDAHGTFNVSARDTYAPEPTLTRISNLYGEPPSDIDEAYFAGDEFASPVSCERAEEQLGWTPQTRWAQLRDES